MTGIFNYMDKGSEALAELLLMCEQYGKNGVEMVNTFQRAYDEHKAVHGSALDYPADEYDMKMKERLKYQVDKAVEFILSNAEPQVREETTKTFKDRILNE